MGVLAFAIFEVVKFKFPGAFDGVPEDGEACFLFRCCMKQKPQNVGLAPVAVPMTPAAQMGSAQPYPIAASSPSPAYGMMPPPVAQPVPADGQPVAPYGQASSPDYSYPLMIKGPQVDGMPDHVEYVCCPFCNVAIQNPPGQQTVQCCQCNNVFMTPN
ncbi:hypothetical protein CYMTET_44902 [Cymbomonas tetramitiformis]|uniref:Uncharacterized protein n=1 Tax=Cymbomonas tetramitiformis TaxID=36881 RepID=A0AAE0C147_9CHLO|nr:hypothetical protein CYMTET_44902 [Cymbomonas tetramitiformis]